MRDIVPLFIAQTYCLVDCMILDHIWILLPRLDLDIESLRDKDDNSCSQQQRFQTNRTQSHFDRGKDTSSLYKREDLMNDDLHEDKLVLC